MPQRTNAFQELVSLVQKALAPAGAVVTDSALLDVAGMSEPREIDVLIETDVGPYRIKIAVEARDHQRKMDSTQFESLIGKYLGEGGVKVNKIVIVTHNGFFEPVVQRAERLGIELMTLKEAKSIDWQKFRPVSVQFKTSPHVCEIDVFPRIGDDFAEAAAKDGRVICSHGTDFGNLRSFAAFLMVNYALRAQFEALRKIDDVAATQPDGKKARVEFSPNHPHVIRLGDESFPIEKLSFIVHFKKTAIPVEFAKSQFVFNFAPHVCKIETTPDVAGGATNELQREGRLVCTCCGKDHGTLMEWANKLIFKEVFPQNPETVKQFRNELIKSPDGNAWLTINAEIDRSKAVRFRGSDYRVSSILIGVHAIAARGPAECKQYELAGSSGDGTLVSHIQATAGGRTFNIVIPHDENGPAKKIALKMDKAKVQVKAKATDLASSNETTDEGAG